MKERIAWALVGFAVGAAVTNLIFVTLLRR
jgi:hypothetical protein